MTHLVNLSDKIALITGASRGIGAAVAKVYASAGAHVILLARNVSGLEKVDDEIKSSGGKATLMPVDLLKLDSLENLGPMLYERFGKLDIFVGNAGILGTLGPLAQADPKEFEKVMDINLMANYRLIRTLDPLLRASDNGRAILVSTGTGVIQGRGYWGAYAVSKAGLETMARVYADETAQTNLRVNVIDPGAVRTEMRKSAKPGEDPMSLPAPDDITQEFLNLAADNCAKHGEIVRIG